MTIKKGELATSVKKNEIHLLGLCWEQQTTSLIAFIFVVLANVGKKIVCLQCGFKSREILTVVITPYYKNVCLCKRHIVVHHAFYFW